MSLTDDIYVGMRPADWDVEMNDDEFEEIDVFAAD